MYVCISVSIPLKTYQCVLWGIDLFQDGELAPFVLSISFTNWTVLWCWDWIQGLLHAQQVPDHWATAPGQPADLTDTFVILHWHLHLGVSGFHSVPLFRTLRLMSILCSGFISVTVTETKQVGKSLFQTTALRVHHCKEALVGAWSTCQRILSQEPRNMMSACLLACAQLHSFTF